MESAVTNAREEAERAATGAQKTLKTLEWLQRTLDLPDMPERIEAFDVSNLGSEGIVAAMTVSARICSSDRARLSASNRARS